MRRKLNPKTTKKGQKCTIDSETKEGQDVVDYLSRQIITAIKAGTISKLGGKLFAPRIVSNIPFPFEEENNIFRRVLEVQFTAQDIGEN